MDTFGRLPSSDIVKEHEIRGKKTNFQEALKIQPGAIPPRR
jgi:hypothetical protein